MHYRCVLYRGAGRLCAAARVSRRGPARLEPSPGAAREGDLDSKHPPKSRGALEGGHDPSRVIRERPQALQGSRPAEAAVAGQRFPARLAVYGRRGVGEHLQYISKGAEPHPLEELPERCLRPHSRRGAMQGEDVGGGRWRRACRGVGGGGCYPLCRQNLTEVVDRNIAGDHAPRREEESLDSRLVASVGTEGRRIRPVQVGEERGESGGNAAQESRPRAALGRLDTAAALAVGHTVLLPLVGRQGEETTVETAIGVVTVRGCLWEVQDALHRPNGDVVCPASRFFPQPRVNVPLQVASPPREVHPGDKRSRLLIVHGS